MATSFERLTVRFTLSTSTTRMGPMEPSVGNIVRVYNLATGPDMREGLNWYTDAHQFAKSLGPLRMSAGVIAALSPLQHWDVNMTFAQLVMGRRDATGCGLYRNVDKANRIMAGENPLSVLGGDKVRSFYQTIVHPHSQRAVACVDRHAYDIAVGAVTNDRERRTLERKGRYALFADCYREAAILAGVSTSQMQAITWVTWRRIKSEK